MGVNVKINQGKPKRLYESPFHAAGAKMDAKKRRSYATAVGCWENTDLQAITELSTKTALEMGVIVKGSNGRV